MNIKEEYNNIKTPEELYNFMDKYIEYGLHGTNGIDYSPDGTEESNQEFQYACQKHYGLASPDYLLTYKLGHCWDQVELERDWFTKHNYRVKTIFIWFLFDYDNSYSTHTYLIYEDQEGYSLFEHADYFNRGIHHFKTYEDALKWQKERHIESNKRHGNEINDEIISHIHIFEYEKPNYGINDQEFLDYVLNSKDITYLLGGI